VRSWPGQAARVGVDLEGPARAGVYLQSDRSIVMRAVEESYRDSVEVMGTMEALSKYPWLKDYWWRIVPVDLDKYTAPGGAGVGSRLLHKGPPGEQGNPPHPLLLPHIKG
jgi:hypothetical protein